MKEAFSVRPRFPENFKYLTLDVEDNEEQNLIRLFPSYVGVERLDELFSDDVIQSAKEFIDSAIRGGGRVLVHCNGET